MYDLRYKKESENILHIYVTCNVGIIDDTKYRIILMTLLVDHNSTRISNRLLVVHIMKNTLGFLMMIMMRNDRSNNNTINLNIFSIYRYFPLSKTPSGRRGN